ncbi:MAG: FGGY family carbohydrate kinase, partial [Acidimicrobiia bacterium]
MTDGVLVIDAGTSGVRAAVVGEDGSVSASVHRQALPSSPMEGFVEFDPVELRDVAVAVAGEALERHGRPVTAVGITNQRASTVLWERASGLPVGPGVSWQDLRTAGMCLLLQSDGLRLAPNASAT